MIVGRKYLYLPIVKMQREFDAKVLLALEAVVSTDAVAVLCDVRWIKLYSGSIPQGIINWGTSKTGLDYLRKFKSEGHVVFGFCEEGVVWDEVVYRARKLDPIMLKELDAFFAWGEAQAEIAWDIQPMANIIVSGHPRMDILMAHHRNIHEKKAMQIRDKFGDYVLIISRGSNYLNVDNLNKLIINRSYIYTTYIDWKKYYKNVADNWQSQVNLTKELANEFPYLNFVFRPKFNESPETVEKYLNSAPNNVIIDGTGNVHPWIMGAKAVISRHCTTMVETALIGIPNICYDPHPWDGFSIRISDDCFPHLNSNDAVKTRLKNILDHNSHTNHYSGLDKHVINYSGQESIPVILSWINLNFPESALTHGLPLRTAKESLINILKSLHEMLSKKQKYEETFSIKDVEDRINELKIIDKRYVKCKISPLKGGAIALYVNNDANTQDSAHI